MKIRRPFRAVVYVALIVAATGYIVFSASRQPAWGNWTLVGRIYAELTGTRASSIAYYGDQLFIAPSNGEWAIVKPNLLNRTDPDSAPSGVINVHFYNRPARTGFWHLVVEERRDSVSFQAFRDGQPPPDHSTRLEILAAADLAYPGLAPPAKREFYAAGGGSTRRILWLGVLGDLSILAAFAAIIYLLVKLRREIMWRKPGHCSECDYDLAGLAGEKCPECGAAVVSATRNEGA